MVCLPKNNLVSFFFFPVITYYAFPQKNKIKKQKRNTNNNNSARINEYKKITKKTKKTICEFAYFFHS